MRLGPSECDFVAIIPGEHITEAGLDYYVRVENGNVSATDPPGAPDAGVFYQAVSAPSEVFPFVPSGGFDTGLPADIDIVLPTGSEFENGTLYYRPGGS